LDTKIAQVLGILKQGGLLNKTMVVLTAEHGIEFNYTVKEL
jgi:membrane-anchored protein YejM (alkaline phosphatase superfamily)